MDSVSGLKYIRTYAERRKNEDRERKATGGKEREDDRNPEDEAGVSGEIEREKDRTRRKKRSR